MPRDGAVNLGQIVLVVTMNEEQLTSSLEKTDTGIDPEAEPHLTCLVYVSRSSTGGENLFDVEGIAQHSRIAAARSRVTGLMVAHNGYYFQAIEGSHNDVLRLFDRIQGDPRHINVELLLVESIRARAFADWSMVSARRTDSVADTQQRFGKVVARLAQIQNVRGLDIFRALFVPNVQGPPLSVPDRRVWRLAFLSPSGLWSANLINFFSEQLQQRVGRIWLSETSSAEEGALVEYVDFDDEDIGHVRAVSFYNDAVSNPALVGILENVAIVVILLTSNEVADGEKYLDRILKHQLVLRYHPTVVLVSSSRTRLDEIMANPMIGKSGVIVRAAHLRVSDSPGIWNEVFKVGEELGQVGGVELSALNALTQGVDAIEESLKSSDLTATSVTGLQGKSARDRVFEPGRLDPPPPPEPPKPKS